ncbi:hypothetical protein [Aeromonas salmonicida]|uniref:hypothetical protein n=1 Tax=Aeromonas salmonicida TaxID=645 RepID=UPI00259E96D3|nr:hypothetical protein [Aeromonas salmonicida]MDM5112949.1 hypothetical protein [Aeromonas salmonicida]
MIPLTELVALFRLMPDRCWDNGRLCGNLRVPDQKTAEFLQDLLSEDRADEYPCEVVEGDPDNVCISDSFELHFHSPRSGVGLIVPNLNTLLRNEQIALGFKSIPWYVVERDEASWEHEGEIPGRLKIVHQLVKVLEGTASIVDERNARLVFLREGQLDIPLSFDSQALLTLDIGLATELIGLLAAQDGHTKQRHEICATAIFDMLSKLPKEQRFSTLLSNIVELHQRFVDGYKLFAASFSFEKVRDQAESIKLEYLGKIHKTFSDIQGQLLGIPVSTIVVATQFKDVTLLTESARMGQMWLNVAILAGACIFCILLTCAVLNQKHTLDALEQEIGRHKRSLEGDHADLKDRLGDVFQKLTDRAWIHRIGLCVVLVVCWGAFSIGCVVFWMLTKTAF